jgi:hypothetical protein
MKKSKAIIPLSLLAASLMVPTVRGYADPNPPGNHRQREELRRDQRELEQLRQRRNHEIREGDRREAREYNERIRDKRRELQRDRQAIFGENDGWWRGNYGWWRRDRDRDHYDFD